MANTSPATIISNVRARAGRSNDTVLITVDFVLGALNKAQKEIVRRIPRQIDMDKSDTTTYQLSTDDESFDISTLDPAHIGHIYILNGGSTNQNGLKYMPLQQFRERYLPISEQGASEPWIWTRQGNTAYFNCPVSSDFNELYLHIDYTDKPTEIPNTISTTVSEISDSDELLTFFALATCFDAMAVAEPAFAANAIKEWSNYEKWMQSYMDENDMKLEGLYGDLDGDYNYDC